MRGSREQREGGTAETSAAGTLGLVVGAAISAYAHAGNGLQTAPLVILALALSTLGTVLSAILILTGRSGKNVVALCALSAAMLLALAILPLVWPYPRSAGPTPIDERPRIGQSR